MQVISAAKQVYGAAPAAWLRRVIRLKSG